MMRKIKISLKKPEEIKAWTYEAEASNLKWLGCKISFDKEGPII